MRAGFSLDGTSIKAFSISAIFVGPKGLRAGWRLLIFVVILLGCQTLLQVWLFHLAPQLVAGEVAMQKGAFSPGALLTNEVANIISVVVSLAAMAKIERRCISEYGLPWHGTFGARFWEGALWGFAMVTFLYLLLRAEHAFLFGSLAVAGGKAVEYGLFWALGTLLVGFYEELVFRGYGQFTLASGIGFWPAAVVLSLAFGLTHLTDAFYTWPGVLSASLYGLVFCLALRRTGTLWLAVGFHSAVDFSETFLFSPPVAGNTTSDHLFNCSLHGPAWLTGGGVGPEAGVNGFAMFAIVFVLFHLIHPPRRTPAAA